MRIKAEEKDREI
jgi:hypothetical protein